MKINRIYHTIYNNFPHIEYTLFYQFAMIAGYRNIASSCCVVFALLSAVFTCFVWFCVVFVLCSVLFCCIALHSAA